MDRCDKFIQWLTALIVIVFVAYISIFLYKQFVDSFESYTKQYVEICDSLKTSSKINNDSLISCYLVKIDTLTREAISKVDNYVTTVDMTIDKANNWIGFWVGLLSALLTISTIFQVWRNYRSKLDFEKQKKLIEDTLNEQKKQFEDNLKNEKEIIEDIKNKTDNTLYESHIISIANCLSNPSNSIMLIPSLRLNYSTFYLNYLYSEFVKYVDMLENAIENRCEENKLMGEDYLTFSKRIIYVLHTINSNITKTQIIITNPNTIFELSLLLDSLTTFTNRLITCDLPRNELIDNLRNIQVRFGMFVKHF